MKKNLTIVFTGPGEVVIENRDIPSPKEGQLLVKTSKTLISTGTELTILEKKNIPAGSIWDVYGSFPFGTQGLDLRNADGEFSVQWFEPYTGRSFDGGKVMGGATRTELIPPINGQVVAFVYKTRNEITRRYGIF